MFRKTTLPNGLRIITVPDKNTKTATVLVLVGAGSKYETEKINGVSHFLEHMFFKGTRKRPNALAVAETLDKVGGIYNAFTSKEHTGYWAKVDYRHLGLALDWVADIFLNSKIEEKEIKKERGVIMEELNMYLDTPLKFIGDLWEELLYGHQPAGWKIIGSKESILRIGRKEILDYLANHYSSRNTVVCVAGNFNEKEVISQIKDYFKSIRTRQPREKAAVWEKQEKPGILSYHKKTDQTHLCLGVRAYHLFDSRKYAEQLLAIILGGNMSSRLFTLIREKMGLAYYLNTFTEFYTDSGYLVTQAGVSHGQVEKAVRTILQEYKRMKEKKVSEGELAKAKDFLKGSTILSLESSEAQASFYGTQELLTAEILTIEKKFRMIDEVRRDDIQKVAQEIFRPEKINLAMIGPRQDFHSFKKLLSDI